MLQLHDITFSYTAPILRNISFDVDSGALLAVLGPNGSGKSTLMKLVVGMLKPESGSVSINGENIASMSRRDAARLMGYVPQESAVRFPLTAMELVLQGRFAQGGVIGFESDLDLAEANWAMEVTETTAFAGTPVTELSGGERQRVMVARALAVRPQLLVLDEPVANLDISHQVKILDLVRRLTVENNMSAIVVTHELNLAADFATGVLLLKSGEKVALGDPQTVLTESLLTSVFETDLLVDKNPVSGSPRITLIRRESKLHAGFAN